MQLYKTQGHFPVDFVSPGVGGEEGHNLEEGPQKIPPFFDPLRCQKGGPQMALFLVSLFAPSLVLPLAPLVSIVEPIGAKEVQKEVKHGVLFRDVENR